MDYFEFYKLTLNTIERFNVTSGQELQKRMNLIPEISSSIKTKQDGVLLGQQFQETLDNLINDGLVNGKRIPTKSGNLYIIQSLSTTGHQYLKNLENPKFSDKLKSILKEEGVPLTPASITRTVAKLFL